MKTWTKGIVAGLVAGVVTLGSLPAVAGPYNSTINQVEMDQERRIQQGLYSGRLTPGEKTQLAQMQERANQNIYRAKHNNYGPANWRPANCRYTNWRPANYRPVCMKTGWQR